MGLVLRGGAVGGFQQRAGEMGLVFPGTLAAVMRTNYRETRVGAGTPGRGRQAVMEAMRCDQILDVFGRIYRGWV